MVDANERMRLYCLSLSCAQAIYGGRQPSLGYAIRVADQLFMTASHESHLVHRRQGVFAGKDTRRGAWSLWQVEWGSMETSLRKLAKKQPHAVRAVNWLTAFQGDSHMVMHQALRGISGLPNRAKADDLAGDSVFVRLLDLMLTKEGDPLGCLFARLHYLRVPAAIPRTTEGMAEYAKEHYNTEAGKATPELYLDAFNQMCPWPLEGR